MGFLGYLGEVESSWDNLKEVEEEAPQPKKKIKKKRFIETVSQTNSDSDYQRYLQLKERFEKEEYLELKKKFEGKTENNVVDEPSTKVNKTPRGYASFILEGMDDGDTGDNQIADNQQPVAPQMDLEEVRNMSSQDLNQLSPKSHASLLL